MFSVEGGVLRITDGERETFNSALPQLNLIPDAAITLTDYSITFPDLWKGTFYWQRRRTVGGGIPGFPTTDEFACATYAALVGQEWGPDKAAPHNLPDITLGTVPEGTDYLDVMVNLTRTVDPALRLMVSIESFFPQGEWVKLEGGSCNIEGVHPLERLFEIILEGTNVILRRRQSVSENGDYRRQAGLANSENELRYFAGTNAPRDGNKFASFGERIQEKGWDDDEAHRPPGYEQGSISNDPCSMNYSSKNYSSVWTGNIIIIPGRVGALP